LRHYLEHKHKIGDGCGEDEQPSISSEPDDIDNFVMRRKEELRYMVQGGISMKY